jgi:cell division protein FtsI (penicillin-binding protein 3)
MVSLPDFDPQDVGKAKPRAKFNQVTLGVYEQGSTFKTLTMASAVDTHSVNISKMYDVKQPIKVGRFRIRDTHPKDMLNASEIYLHSSNIGTAKIALDMGIANQKEYLEKLGIFAPLTIEIPEKGEPLLPKQWSEVTSMTVSFGHGIAVTPVHVVQATAAIMNGGIFHPATLIKQPEGIIPEGRRVVSEDTSEYMRRLFRMNVLEGTGKRANVEGYMVGGKTGTAEKAQAGGYNRKAMLSSFVAAFPMHEPKYVVYVMLDEPKGTKETGGFATGGMVAAPVVKEVISNIAPMLGLRPIDNHDMDIKKEFYVEDENGTGAREYAALTTF